MAIRCINYCVFFMFMADASIIPFQLSAHLSSTVYGIAEKVFKDHVSIQRIING